MKNASIFFDGLTIKILILLNFFITELKYGDINDSLILFISQMISFSVITINCHVVTRTNFFFVYGYRFNCWKSFISCHCLNKGKCLLMAGFHNW